MRLLHLLTLAIVVGIGPLARDSEGAAGITRAYTCAPSQRTFCNRSSCTREPGGSTVAQYDFRDDTRTLTACLATDCYTGRAAMVTTDSEAPARFTATGLVTSQRPATGSPPPGMPPFPLTLAIDPVSANFSALWGATAEGVVLDQGGCRETITVAPVTFAHDSVQLSKAARRRLDLLVKLLRQRPDLTVTLVGNTDERYSSEYALALGERMAAAVASKMKAGGVAASRIVILSNGKEQPRDPRHTPAAWGKNRRVEIVVRKSDRGDVR